MEELNKLFDAWEQKHQTAGYKNFIRDGIVNEEWWWQTKEQRNNVPRICYFLKEARSNEENYNLVESLNKYRPWKLWQKVAIWTQAIQSAFAEEVIYDADLIKKKEHDLIRQIAVVNIKKSNGKPTSDNEELWRFAEDDRELLKHQLKLIDADIIVCGYTFGMLCKVLEDEIEMNGTADRMFAFWKDKLIIDYFHPACRYPNRINYYALMSICRLASEEWYGRKLIYELNHNRNNGT